MPVDKTKSFLHFDKYLINGKFVISPDGIFINLTLRPTKNFALFKSKTLAEYVIFFYYNNCII